MNYNLRTNKAFTPLEKAPDFSPGCKWGPKSVAEDGGIKPPLHRAQASFVRELRSLTGFTLVELVVAIGLLAIVLSFAGVIFKVGIESYRTADANTEIMQKLRAITDQLNADFKGLQKDAPLLIWFELELDEDGNPYRRHDQILFFANGDFQSTQVYQATGEPVIGNVARIYYGQANPTDPNVTYLSFNTLAKRQHILTADPDLPVFPDPDTPESFAATFTTSNNDNLEYDSISLADWKRLSNNQDNNNWMVLICFENNNRPGIDLRSPSGLHMLMSQGVDSFSVQWGYWYGGEYQWWPSNESDFDNMMVAHNLPERSFGVYFNMPDRVDIALRWFDPEDAENEDYGNFDGFYPTALKFTFTLYDSKQVFKQGQTFTHIVYLAD